MSFGQVNTWSQAIALREDRLQLAIAIDVSFCVDLRAENSYHGSSNVLLGDICLVE